MRGHLSQQEAMWSYLSPDARVPVHHPIRQIKRLADEALRPLERTFTAMYSRLGRPSIPPERLLKAQLLIALYSVRSDRLFCERLDYDILFRWFVDMDLDAPSWDHSTFSANRDRLLAHAVARQFFDAVVMHARRADLLSDEHFTVDGTLIEASASMKSLKPSTGAERPATPPDDRSNPTVNFHGERRTNATHQSTTDPEARLMRKGAGKEARLAFAGHVLMDNRHGLCVDLTVTPATGTAEREAALKMLRRQVRRKIRPRTLGADKGYHTRAFVQALRARHIRPHVARVRDRQTPGLDGRTTRTKSYGVSQRLRKRIEEIFGWCKTVGQLAKTRFRGVQRTEHAAHWVGATYNLVRMSRLLSPQLSP